MVAAEKTKPEIVERAKQTISTRTVFIRSNTTGVLPMERRLPDGSRNVSRCEYNNFGKMVNRVDVRPLDFGTTGVQVINPADRDDADLLAECRQWIAQGDDPRIQKYQVRIQEGGSAEAAPIPRYEKYKPEALIRRIGEELDLIGDDPVTAREFLEACARFELQRQNPDDARIRPRQKILDAIDQLGASSGVEYGTDVVEEA